MKTYVCGHRNPDTDSIMSAYALADLRRRTGMADVEAICAGRLPEKAKWVFDHFGAEPVRAKRDVYVRVRHLIDRSVPMIDADISLVDALRKLEASGESSLPVRGRDGSFAGMLSPAKLLNLFLSRGDLTIPVGRAPLHHCAQVLIDSDPVHDIRVAAVKSSHNHFPVVDENGKLMGTVLKRAFAEEPPFRMILVDHNETDQGIPGLEEVPVVEVVDHHRIAFAATREPIRYTADVVGSTCTLVARMFRAVGERPTRATAGILIAGIVSDTLLFQSPTTTDADRSLCSWLEKLCGESAESIMEGMSSIASPLTSLSPDDAIASDAKTYNEAGRKFMLAQIEETHMAFFHRHKDELSAAIDRAIKANALDFFALMVTDPVRGNSELLFRGLESVRRALPYRKGPNGTLVMPGVLSRKKQLLPEVIAALS
ncbi:MAG: DHH family phosphoesterase [Kiritimatiellae bacterium]|nr:DHH family phosphoesterase [Kiritimatiellia bacterium]